MSCDFEVTNENTRCCNPISNYITTLDTFHGGTLHKSKLLLGKLNCFVREKGVNIVAVILFIYSFIYFMLIIWIFTDKHSLDFN